MKSKIPFLGTIIFFSAVSAELNNQAGLVPHAVPSLKKLLAHHLIKQPLSAEDLARIPAEAKLVLLDQLKIQPNLSYDLFWALDDHQLPCLIHHVNQDDLSDLGWANENTLLYETSDQEFWAWDLATNKCTLWNGEFTSYIKARLNLSHEDETHFKVSVGDELIAKFDKKKIVKWLRQENHGEEFQITDIIPNGEQPLIIFQIPIPFADPYVPMLKFGTDFRLSLDCEHEIIAAKTDDGTFSKYFLNSRQYDQSHEGAFVCHYEISDGELRLIKTETDYLHYQGMCLNTNLSLLATIIPTGIRVIPNLRASLELDEDSVDTILMAQDKKSALAKAIFKANGINF